jgi:hypothetical protein
MLAVDRWRKWRPSDEKFNESPRYEPSKPSKPIFGGFEGATPGRIQNVAVDLATEESVSRGRMFPHCPHCASYALYRQNNIGPYECQTCGLGKIEESLARRVQ